VLSEICVCAGLASNLAAMRALATEGIQRGHMSLHARQIAMAAGAHGAEIDEITRRMVEEKLIKPAHAEMLLLELRAVAVKR
jgi:hydroxymethylglutaryl-CoA reductase